MDIAGAHATPADGSAWATGTQGAGAADVTTCPSITPTTNGSGITINVIAFGTGPPTTAYGPVGAITGNTGYTGDTDGGNMNYGDGYAHFFHTSNAAQTWNWHTATPVASGWIAQAVVFKAP
jgi:hypothetical protein